MLSLILDCWPVRPIIISSAKSAANACGLNLLYMLFADLELLSCHYHHFICQNRDKCSRFKPQRGLNLLYMLSLILDCGAVTTIISSTKSAANACGLNLLHMLSLILDCWAVTTIISSTKSAANAADSNHSVVWICCTCLGWSWTAELLLPSFHLPKLQQIQQIQTTAWSESAVHAFADLGLRSCHYHHFIYQKRSKCSRFKPQRGLNLLYMPSLILDCWAVTTIISSAIIAANAADSNHSVVWICCTCFSLILDCWAVTTIISSTKSAANAADSNHSVVWICCTCFRWSWTAELSDR